MLKVLGSRLTPGIDNRSLSPVRMSARLCVGVVLAGALFGTLVSASPAVAAPAVGRYIVVLKTGASEPRAESYATASGARVLARYRHALNGYTAQLSSDDLAKIKADPRVDFVSPDTQVAGLANSCTDPTTCQILTSSVVRIGGDRSSTRSGDGRGAVNVNVAVLDSGIDTTHPDLNVVGGKNCSTGQSFDDENGHGTLVAGKIGAKDNGIGFVGIAPGARLWAVRVLNKQLSGSVSSVLCGVDWVTSTRQDTDPTNDIAVANMSLGSKGEDDGNCGHTRNDPLHEAICNSTSAGVTYVAAAGNSSTDFQNTAPAAYDEVLTATAMTDTDGQPGGAGPQAFCGPFSDDTASPFSNFATLPADRAHTVAAPGACISSTYPGGQYGADTGTSFAAPSVTGLAALCIASGKRPCAGLSPPRVVQRIANDAGGYNTSNPNYGFAGDPLHTQDPGTYYGFLINAGLY